ncbi:MAG: hypothetical protein ACOYOA_14205 [Saprospiraceae bacterium]
MHFKKTVIYLIFFMIFIVFACGKDENEKLPSENKGYDYYPLQTGKYKIFQVDSILFDSVASGVKIDSFRTYLKEEIVDTFKNALGTVVYRIERYEKKVLNDPWIFKDIVAAEKDSTKAIRLENNFRLLKLVFPVHGRQIWNSTLYIDNTVEVKAGKKEIVMFKNWEGEVFSFGKAETIKGKNYEDVLDVYQANDENSIELRRVREKYAKGIGLISNEMEILDTQKPGPQPWRKKAQKGFILHQILIENN